LDPTLLPAIVKKSPFMRIACFQYIENPPIFTMPLIAGVDEINICPAPLLARTRYSTVDESKFPMPDARLAAAHGLMSSPLSPAQATRGSPCSVNNRTVKLRNLRILIEVWRQDRLGSDAISADTLSEALYLNSLHVMSPQTLF